MKSKSDEANTKQLKPSTLRAVLITLLVLIIICHAFVVILGQNFLKKSSEKVAQAVTISNSSKETLSRLYNAEQQLSIQKAIVDKSRLLVADSENSSYQDMIIHDLNNYAEVAGIKIKGYNFSSADTTGSSKKSSSSTSTKNGNQKTIPGLKIETVTIELESPMEHQSLVKFLRLIDKNVLQLTLQSLAISSKPPSESQGSSASNTLVESPTLTFEVYVK